MGRPIKNFGSGGAKGSFSKNPEETGFMKVIHGLSTPLYITAGLIDEVVKREKGERATPYADILKESSSNLLPWVSDARRRTTYGDIIGDDTLPKKGAAFLLDVFGDPLTYVPAAGLAKVGKGISTVGRVALKTPLKAAIRGVDRGLGTEFLIGGEKLVDSVRRAVIPHADLKRLGGNELLKLKRGSYRDIEKSARELGEQIEKELTEVMPSLGTREKVFDLVERRPVIVEGGKLSQADRLALTQDEDYLKWGEEIRALTSDEYSAFNKTVRIQKKLEKWKQETGLVTAEHMANFVNKFKIQYLPHMRATREEAVSQGEAMIKAIREGTPDGVDYVKKSGTTDKKAIKEIDKRIRRDAQLGQVVDPNELYKQRNKLSMTYPRGAALPEALNRDVARVLGVEGAQVGRAAAALRYSKSLASWADNKGYVWREAPGKDALIEKFGQEQAETLMRGGFKKIKVPGTDINGKMVPKAIAGDIEAVFKAYRSPAAIKEVLHTFKKVQDVWKAWTLAIFPTYHARNHISNIWNNFLAGMGPTSTKHYDEAMRLLYSSKHGQLDDVGKKLIKEAEDMRVIGGGQFEGELGDIMKQKWSKLTPYGKVAYSAIHPAHNKAIQKGFGIGRTLEDHARLAHYLWAKNAKGLSMEDAAISVNKYLFDYRYGLTPFEKKAFRDLAAPFYAWTRFNIPLQLEMLALKPGRMMTLPKGMRAFEDTASWFTEGSEMGGPEPNEMFMADWMKRALKIRTRWNPKTEAYEYFMLDNWIPSADLNRLSSTEGFRDLVTGLLSPFIKMPIEILFNYNLFQKKKIRDYKGQKKRFLGVEMAPELEHAARTIRLFNEADKMYDAFIAKTGETSKAEAATRFLLGKVYPYKPEQQRDWWVSGTNKKIGSMRYLRNYAEKHGEINQMKVLEGVLEELTAERDYFKELKIEKPGKRRKRAKRDNQWP